jgi:hypothetical protein
MSSGNEMVLKNICKNYTNNDVRLVLHIQTPAQGRAVAKMIIHRLLNMKAQISP